MIATKQCGFIYTDPQKLRRLENARKVAFMMAWHPRLGENSDIRQYVAKDVAKLIANQYLTSKSQICLSGKPILLQQRPAFEQELEVAVHTEKQNMKNGVSLIKFSFLDRSLVRYHNIRIQTPVMILPFNPIQQIGLNTIRNIALSIARSEDEWFSKWMNDLDVSFRTGIWLTLPNNSFYYGHENLFIEAYNPTFRGIKNSSLFMHLRIPTTRWEKITVYNTEKKSIGSLKTVWDNGAFAKGTKVQVIMRHVGVWDTNRNFTNQWSLEQLVLIKSAQQVEEEELYSKFIINSDDDENF